jgi:hypothetical protein
MATAPAAGPRKAAAPAVLTTPAPPVQVVVAEETPIDGELPVLRVRAPRPGQVVRTEHVELRVELQHWPLSSDGDYVQLYVDDEPAIALHDTTHPLELRALLRDARGHDLAVGPHVLRLIATRGQHETVKSSGAFALTHFYFKRQEPELRFDAAAPRLGFNAPSGCVELGSRAMLDFFVENARLATDGVRVHYVIDDALDGDIVQREPHSIENLTAGKHTIRLSLLGPGGTSIAGPFTASEHTFLVARDCKALAIEAPATVAEPATPARPDPTVH